MHPGYGFLSERAEFARAVEDAGPGVRRPDLRADRADGRQGACPRGGTSGRRADDPGLRRRRGRRRRRCARGGRDRLPGRAQGGRRGRRARHPDRRTTRRSCGGVRGGAREAAGAFGDARIYVERFVSPARHVEVQVLGDGATLRAPVRARVLAAAAAPEGRRGVARARPAPSDPRRAVRRGACGCARRSATAAPGTVEFLVDARAGEFFFIEMNTRIQVEHPVTELVTGVDLVAEQLRIAAGEPLRLRAGRHRVARLRDRAAAERRGPGATGFMPSPGTVDAVPLPAGPWVRVDAWLEPGGEVPPFYDSLLGKLIVWGDDRETALAPRAPRARRARGRGHPHHGAAAREIAGGRTGSPPRDFHTATLEAWLRRRHEPLQLGRRRAPVRRGRRGDEPAGLLPAMAIVTALRERRPDGVLDICPANASYQVRFDPDVLEPAKLLEPGHARSRSEVGDAHGFELADPDRRDPGALRRPVDARDADALPRPPPGPGRHRPRVRRAHQRLRRRRGVHRRALRVAVARLDGRVRRRAAVPVPDGPARAPARGARSTCGPRTDTPKQTVGHGGCFGCIYSVRGAGGYQMFGITPAPIYDPRQALPDFERLRVLLPARRHRQVRADRPRRATTRCASRGGGRAGSRSGAAPVTFNAARSSSTTPTATTPGCWRCSVPIEVRKPGLVDDDPGPRARGLLPRRHAAVGRARPVLAARRQPAGRQHPRRGRRWSAPTWARSWCSARTPSSRSPAPSSSRGSTARRSRRGPSFAVPAGATLSLRPPRGAARARTSPSRAGSTCRRSSAAARPTRSARWAGSRAGRWPSRRQAARGALANGARPGASVPERAAAGPVRASSRCAW